MKPKVKITKPIDGTTIIVTMPDRSKYGIAAPPGVPEDVLARSVDQIIGSFQARARMDSERLLATRCPVDSPLSYDILKESTPC